VTPAPDVAIPTRIHGTIARGNGISMRKNFTEPTSYFSESLPALYAAAWFLVLTALAGIAAYYWIFSGFGFWDDEGSLLVSVRQFLAGVKLYGQFPDYGPVYYFYQWLLHAVSGTPATHDSFRTGALISWLLTALVCAWIVLRLTQSLLLASVTHIFSFWALSFLRNSPGHPQELCILLTVALVASGILAVDPRGAPRP